MAHQAKFAITGLRGVWGDTLTEEIARAHIEAYTLFLQKHGANKVILGRDSRHSGPIIRQIAVDILTRAGLQIIDVGVVPTPTVIFLIRTTSSNGGIMISASHNPPEYNGVKFFNSKAFYISEEELDEIKSFLGSTPEARGGGKHRQDSALALGHVEQVIKNINAKLIQEKKFKVVIDTINGAGYLLGPMLLEKLGCEVTVINPLPDGNFAHMPEPLAENLTGLAEKVCEVGADIGFAQDPDADRLVLCDEKGVIIFEEYMLSLCIKSVLEQTPGDIVTNISSSNTNQDLVQAVGHNIYRTKVGEGSVVKGILEHNAVIGGEGSGGVIYPKMNLCRDSITGMALILESLALSGKPISEMVEELPRYEFIKTKMPFEGSVKDIIDKVIREFGEGVADTQDGVRVDFPDSSWVQLRASNTEPIIRIWAEAKTKDRAQELINKASSHISK